MGPTSKGRGEEEVEGEEEGEGRWRGVGRGKGKGRGREGKGEPHFFVQVYAPGAIGRRPHGLFAPHHSSPHST